MNEIKHPVHYQGTKNFECIEVMEMVFGRESVKHFCFLNAFKYIWRDGVKVDNNRSKAKCYLDYVVENYSLSEKELEIYDRLNTIIDSLEEDNEKSFH